MVERKIFSASTVSAWLDRAATAAPKGSGSGTAGHTTSGPLRPCCRSGMEPSARYRGDAIVDARVSSEQAVGVRGAAFGGNQRCGSEAIAHFEASAERRGRVERLARTGMVGVGLGDRQDDSRLPARKRREH